MATSCDCRRLTTDKNYFADDESLHHRAVASPLSATRTGLSLGQSGLANRPRCHPEVALADAVIALTTNLAIAKGTRIEFQEEWFDPDSKETPEGIPPDISRYA